MNRRIAACVTFATALAGCASPGADGSTTDAPGLASSEVGTRQVVTSVNASGTWTASASGTAFYDPQGGYGIAQGEATFTGPTGATRKMGVCLLQQYDQGAGTLVACSTVSDCGAAPTTLPTGGVRYCLAPNGSGTKYCSFRPGSQTDFCAGSPANGGAAIAAGTYDTPVTGAYLGSMWIAEACFEGCATIAGSVSYQMVASF